MTGVHIGPFHAAQGTIKFNTGQITWDASTLLSNEAYNNTVVTCKSITVTPPKGEVEIVQLLGETTQTIGAGVISTGTFQNAVFDQKAYSEANMSCTLLLTGDETNLPDFLRMSTGSGQTISTARRHTFGDSTNNQKRITDGAILLVLEDGTNTVGVVMNKPLCNVGDVSLTGADGHFEINFEAKCLPQDFVYEVN